jgi:Ca2+-binding RTX toxin-like protein/GH24 family phage-related lysozyme (muramidase)
MIDLNTLGSTYDLIRFTFISNAEGYTSVIADDGAGIPSIGIGFKLTDDDVRNYVLDEITGGNVPSGLDHDIENIVDNGWVAGTGGTVDQINSVMASYHATNSNVPATFSITTTQADNIYQNIVGTYESRVDNKISGVADSYERVALVSLAYNSTSLIGPSLQSAILNDDRAEAWYQIRYQSNADTQHAKRRYYESDMFSLYKDRHDVTNKEAIDVYKMIERHSSQISSYDATYGEMINTHLDAYGHPVNANHDYDTSMLQDGKVDTFNEDIAPAHDYLESTYASGPAAHGALIDNIWVDYTLLDPYDTDPTHEQNAYSGTSGNDLIFTGAGNDVLSGGNGDDTFVITGSGTKTIDGGSGNDTLSFLGFDANLEGGLYGNFYINTVNLESGTFGVQTFGSPSDPSAFVTGTISGIENLVGRGTQYTTDLSAVINHREVFWGDSHDNIFDTRSGSESYVYGGGGNDTVVWSPEYYGRLNIVDEYDSTSSNTNYTIQLQGMTTSNVLGFKDVTDYGGYKEYIFVVSSQTNGQSYQTVLDPSFLVILLKDGSTLEFKNPDNSTVSASSLASTYSQVDWGKIYSNLLIIESGAAGIRSGGDDTGGNGNSGASGTTPPLLSTVHQEINTHVTTYYAPLVIDLGGNGLDVSASTKVYLNTTVDNFQVASSWVGPENAILVNDTNGNGIIDGINEMFASPSDYSGPTGFTQLSGLDSNHDGIIDSSDTNFSQLKIWVDTNQDGISQFNEMQTLTDAGIKSLNVSYLTGHSEVLNNQYFNYSSSEVIMTDNSTRTMAESWLMQDGQNTNYHPTILETATDYFRHLHLNGSGPFPLMRGFGLVKDLDIQASQDSNFSTKVSSLAGLTTSQVLDPAQHFDDKFHDMLYQWIGVPANWQSHAYFANPFEVTVVNALAGLNTSIYQWSGTAYNDGAWEQSLSYFQGTFLAQTAFHDLFTGSTAHYDMNSGMFVNVTGLSSTFLSSLETTIGSSSDAAYDWALVVRTVDAVIGYDNLSTGDHNALDSAIQSTASGWTLDSIHALTIAPPADLYAPDNNDTVLTGTFANDHIFGLGGNDTLIGGSGDDYLYGNIGNDIYQPGTGYNFMSDGSGSYSDDTYVYGGGHDVIAGDLGGTNVIQFGSGITLSDISIERVNTLDHSNLNLANTNTDLIVHVAGQGEVDIAYNYGYTSAIQTLHFSNSTTLDLVHLDDPIYGTVYDDTLTGVDRAYYLSDRIIADNGNDTLNGGLGTNYLEGGRGDDTYVYGGGLDYIHDNGDGTDTLQFANTFNPSLFTFQYVTDGAHPDMTVLYDGHAVAVLAGQLSSDSHFIEYVTVDGVHTFDLSALDYTIHGTEGNDSLFGLDAAPIQNNTMYGHGGDDYMDGRSGDDTMYGGDGNDTMVGGDGNDTLIGGAGDDYLQGDNGTNTLNGGTGSNTMYINYYANDTVILDHDALSATNAITGFNASNDKLELHDLLTGFTPGTSSITDYVQFTTSGGNTAVSVDIDGAGTAHTFQQVATLNYVTGLNVSDLYNNGHLTVTS